MKESTEDNINTVSFEDFQKDVLNDYRIANESRQASLIGRKEVLTGKAKFGIFGDGKEVAQLAMAKQFRAGDFRSGYYRDQTFMFATGESIGEAPLTVVLRRHFDDYAAFHRTRGNRACHSLGIPLIVLASLALLARVQLFEAAGFALTLAELLIVVSVAYYLTLDAPLAGWMLLAYAALDVVGRFIPPLPALGLFGFGWILQGVGHWVYEKNSPAFFRNVVHLAVGQLWILAKAVGRA